MKLITYIFLLLSCVVNAQQPKPTENQPFFKVRIGNHTREVSGQEALIKPYAATEKSIELVDEFVSTAANANTTGISALQWNRGNAGATITSITPTTPNVGLLGVNSGATVGNFNFLSLTSGGVTSSSTMFLQANDTITWIIGIPAGQTVTNYSDISVGFASNTVNSGVGINPITNTASTFACVRFEPNFGIHCAVNTGTGVILSAIQGTIPLTSGFFKVKMWIQATGIGVEVYNYTTNIKYVNNTAMVLNTGAVAFRPFYQNWKTAGATNFTGTIDHFSFKRINLIR